MLRGDGRFIVAYSGWGSNGLARSARLVPLDPKVIRIVLRPQKAIVAKLLTRKLPWKQASNMAWAAMSSMLRALPIVGEPVPGTLERAFGTTTLQVPRYNFARPGWSGSFCPSPRPSSTAVPAKPRCGNLCHAESEQDDFALPRPRPASCGSAASDLQFTV